MPVHVEPLVFDLLRLFVENCRRGRRPRPDAGRGLGRPLRLGGDAVDRGQVGAAGARRQRRGADLDRDGARPRLPLQGGGLGRGAGAPGVGRRAPPATEPEAPARSAPSIAVLPFVRIGDAGAFPGLEDGLPYEVIIALARLHWLFVIARGSSFRFRGPAVDVADGRTDVRGALRADRDRRDPRRAARGRGRARRDRDRRRGLGRAVRGADRRRARDAGRHRPRHHRGARGADPAARGAAHARPPGGKPRRLAAPSTSD